MHHLYIIICHYISLVYHFISLYIAHISYRYHSYHTYITIYHSYIIIYHSTSLIHLYVSVIHSYINIYHSYIILTSIIYHSYSHAPSAWPPLSRPCTPDASQGACAQPPEASTTFCVSCTAPLRYQLRPPQACNADVVNASQRGCPSSPPPM